MLYFIAFVITFALSAVFTVVVSILAKRLNIVDDPAAARERKIHQKTTPLLGGLAVIASFMLVSLGFYFAHDLLPENITFSSMAAIWIGALILAVGGFWDDLKNLSPGKQFIFPLLAALVVIAVGINIPHLTNPFDGRLILGGPEILGISLISGLVVVFWLLGMVYTTKLLDGMDGLASSIGIVAAIILFALSFTPQVQQSYTALLAIIAVGAIAGFLIFNWHPATIFLGESGSTFIGFILGILAIIAGGKIATAFLVMGVAILDVARVIIRRLYNRGSPFKADRRHLHHVLLDIGLSQPQVVVFLVLVSLTFGGLAVILQSFGKLITLFGLVIFMIALLLVVMRLTKQKIGLKGEELTK